MNLEILEIHDPESGQLKGGVFHLDTDPWNVGCTFRPDPDLFFWVLGHNDLRDEDSLIFCWEKRNEIHFKSLDEPLVTDCIVSFYVEKIIVKLDLPSAEETARIINNDATSKYIDLEELDAVCRDNPDSYIVYEVKDGKLDDNVYKYSHIHTKKQTAKILKANRLLKGFLSGVVRAGAPDHNHNRKSETLPDWVKEELREKPYKNQTTGEEFTSLERFADSLRNLTPPIPTSVRTLRRIKND